MKGKKVDSQFVSEFISDCVMLGYDTPEKIANHAQNTIKDIDEEIKRLESKKMLRSKLLDVIATFEKPVKPNKSEEARALSFFKIQHPQICNVICNAIKHGVITAEDVIKQDNYSSADVLFCIKQLLEYKVIFRSGSHLLRGELFEEYLKFVLKES